MKLELVHVKENDKMILKNLLELYEGEPNDYEEKDLNEKKPYEYKHLEYYFTKKKLACIFYNGR